MKTKARLPLNILLLVVVGALASGCGSDEDSTSSAASGNPIDRAFVQQMVPHHRSALEMAAIAKTEATSAFVKKLAADIASSQAAEIAQMQRIDGRLAGAGIGVGDLGISHEKMGMTMDASQLRGAKPFDNAFIAAMIPHHEGAITMARIELDKGENGELTQLAKSIIRLQRSEVTAMRAHEKDSSGSSMDGMDGDKKGSSGSSMDRMDTDHPG